MRFLFVVFCFTCLCNHCYSYTDFVHLLGYSLKADILSTFDTDNDTECSIECANTANCIGFQMLHGTGTCSLLTMLRSAMYDSNQCQYYLKKSTSVDIENRQLTDIDKLVQNAVYNSQGECPDGWDSEVTICTLDVEEDVCNEYAAFLETSYDFVCTVNLMSINYTCPNESFTLGSFSNGHYCYIFVPKYDEAENPNNLTYYEKSNQYCKETTGGYLASIHSEDENTLINTIQNETTDGTVGTIIGLVSDTSPVSSADDMYWLDGTDVDYVNYVGGTPVSSNPFYLTLMPISGRWNAKMMSHVVVAKFKFIACKQSAKAVMKTFTI